MLRSSNLRGFKIPGTEDKLIARLFADDTTVFLSEFDDFEDLQKILKKWCIASKAKFNIGKTEILPIGTPEYRETVIRERKTEGCVVPINDDIHMVAEGESIRLLGAWYGNNLEVEGPWTIVLNKIDKKLEQWERTHPTILGRKLIVMLTAGSMTQYLTTVQGMPPHIETKIARRISSFMRADKSAAAVAEETL
ncbi:hypothetical protein PUNSTDRAFT_36823, partial [Punctularia strigosozonata HHB-11173 SS5]|uniref:uncharacterized protein n=1 Tax=Punctularia strigosozonata (strain HHB-11173) TaxID=741275 RepID=UPI0004416C90